MGLFIISIIPWSVFVIFKYKKALHMLQQNLYNHDSRYLTWLYRNYKKVLGEIDILLVIPLMFYWNKTIFMIIFFITYSIFTIVHYNKLKNEQTKKPLVITARVKRLITTIFIIYLASSIYLVSNFFFDNIILYYVIIMGMTYFAYIVVYIANIINYPIERGYFYYYMYKAKSKLKSMKNLKIIGITGSYGKTTSKNILSDILSVKFNTLPTPKSLNTPNGLMITINNHLDKFDEIFIAEMGSYKIGEIKELCDLVSPKYGVVTIIGKAHLESFGSEENIQKGKFELIESLPQDGIGILNGDDHLQVSYKLKNNCKIVWIGIDNKDVDVYASNIECSEKGTTFDVTFKGDKTKYKFQTKLLGYFNVYNILAAIALGKELGIDIPGLQVGVRKVRPTEHRLELKRGPGVIIIDDAYNSNPSGAKMALEVLSIMKGKKVIVTPGMIELGSKQYELNKEFGKQIAAVCDEVILVGEKQTKPIQDGLKEKGYDKKKIHIVNDIKLAFNIINKIKDSNTYVLLENDLPDIFNE
ncbi:MAG: UDP-N-acetylmuramoyl-tripeptide--D-alanyl-D-alanine ligase [Bacilli bacterium]|nr:UDP-N-acetylmuramoyl-tripeptide--D-alanyl-D-alanine ligase [Bacilli bacterium]